MKTIAVSIAVLLAIASPAGAATPAQRIYKLKRQVQTLRTSRDHWRDLAWKRYDQLGERAQVIANLGSEIQGLRSQVDTLTTQIGNLTATNQQLAKGLPDAIAAVPITQFVSLVLDPAYRRWPCHDLTTSSGGYWLMSFYSLNLCP